MSQGGSGPYTASGRFGASTIQEDRLEPSTQDKMTCDLRPLPCAWQPLIGIAPETGSRLDLLRRSNLLRRSRFPAKRERRRPYPGQSVNQPIGVNHSASHWGRLAENPQKGLVAPRLQPHRYHTDLWKRLSRIKTAKIADSSDAAAHYSSAAFRALRGFGAWTLNGAAL